MFVWPWEEGAAGAEVPERLVAMETGRLLLTGVVAVSGEPQLLSPPGPAVYLGRRCRGTPWSPGNPRCAPRLSSGREESRGPQGDRWLC